MAGRAFKLTTPIVPPSNGWEVVADASGVLNVIPIADRATHRLGKLCWCRPTLDDDVLVHHAADRREDYEQGRLPS